MRTRSAMSSVAVLLAGALTLRGGAVAPAGVGSPATPQGSRGQPGLTLVTEPDAGMDPIYDLLGSAKRSLDLVAYELEDPVAEQVLAADAARGVVVRVILDRAGIGGANDAARSYLIAHHVAVHWASARYELTHEKAAVIDGRVALVMTLNLGSAAYEAADRDFALVDRQEADVSAIETTFDADWAGRPIEPRHGVDLLWSPGAETPMLSLIASARSSLLVENEEMGDPLVTQALAAAARRKVRVVVVMSDPAEWARAFAQLVRAGVEVRTYPGGGTGRYIHAKVVVVDAGSPGARVFVGSENFSYPSLAFDRELGVVTADPSIVDGVAHVVEVDASGATAWH